MYTCYTFLILMLLCIISMNIYTYNNYLDDSQKINRLIRQTARWATAANQDTNAYISNLHATYAVGYLMALREIYMDETITRLSNVDVRKLDIHINQIMDDAVKKLINVCPDGQPKNKYLAYLSKQGE
jgi:hypothetical protein